MIIRNIHNYLRFMMTIFGWIFHLKKFIMNGKFIQKKRQPGSFSIFNANFSMKSHHKNKK